MCLVTLTIGFFSSVSCVVFILFGAVGLSGPPCSTSPLDSVIYNPANSTILTVNRDGDADLWPSTGGQPIQHFLFASHVDRVLNIAYAPDGKTVVTCGDSMAMLWDLQTGTPLRRLDDFSTGLTSENWATSIAYASDGETILATYYNSKIAKLWDTHSGVLLHTLSGHKNEVMSVAYAPDSKTMLTTGDDYTAKLWDTDSGTLLHTLTLYTPSAADTPGEQITTSATFSPDGKTILATSNGDVQSGTLLHLLCSPALTATPTK